MSLATRLFVAVRGGLLSPSPRCHRSIGRAGAAASPPHPDLNLP